MIVVREILSQTQMKRNQEIFGDTLLYPVILSDCPGSKRGVFYILVVDLILRSALVVFILLRSSNYHYNKGPVCYLFLSFLSFGPASKVPKLTHYEVV